jgi:hypothetical protein
MLDLRGDGRVIDYPDAVAIVGIFWSIGWTITRGKTHPRCSDHSIVASDLASIKGCMIKMAVYVSDKSTIEGRNLESETITAMMKNRGGCSNG